MRQRNDGAALFLVSFVLTGVLIMIGVVACGTGDDDIANTRATTVQQAQVVVTPPATTAEPTHPASRKHKRQTLAAPVTARTTPSAHHHATPKPRPRVKHTVRPKPRPTHTHQPAPAPGVHPGAFCTPAGATGVHNGHTYTCKSSATETRLRWRR